MQGSGRPSAFPSLYTQYFRAYNFKREHREAMKDCNLIFSPIKLMPNSQLFVGDVGPRFISFDTLKSLYTYPS